MKLYLAYKYKKTRDKDLLKKDLEKLSKPLESEGHTVFLLGRDVQKWGKAKVDHIKNVTVIVNNIKRSDVLVAYVNSRVFSFGLAFEFLVGKLLGKKILLANKKGMGTSFYNIFCSKKVDFEDVDDLSKLLPALLTQI